MGYGMDDLKNQLDILMADQRKTTQKLYEIRGAIKIIEHMIKTINTPVILETEKDGTNGDH